MVLKCHPRVRNPSGCRPGTYAGPFTASALKLATSPLASHSGTGPLPVSDLITVEAARACPAAGAAQRLAEQPGSRLSEPRAAVAVVSDRIKTTRSLLVLGTSCTFRRPFTIFIVTTLLAVADGSEASKPLEAMFTMPLNRVLSAFDSVS